MALQQQLAIWFIRTKFQLLSRLSKKQTAVRAFQLFCTPQHRNKKPLPPIFLKAEVLHFTFQENKIQGYRWNKGRAKKAIILHGFESSVVNFDRYVAPLLKKGYEVLAFDAPAHGRSIGRQIDVMVYSQFIQTVYKTYGPVDAFLAHSLGGLALSIALEEIQPSPDSKVVLIAPATETKTAIAYFFNFLKLDAALRPYFDEIILQKSGHPTEWFSVTRAIATINAQVLWVHDKDDTLTPYADVEAAQQNQKPNIRFMITEGLGHRRIYRDNTVTKAIIDFL